MFSDEGRTLDEETLEYAWLVEIQLGKLGGKVTAPQVKLLNGCEPVPASHPAWQALAHIHLQQTCSTHSLKATCCLQHSAMLPVEISDLRKCLSTLSVAKPR
jgi:hypothetical protein